MRFPGYEARGHAVQQATYHAADGERDHAIKRVGAGARVEVAKGVQEEKDQRQQREAHVPLQRGIKLPHDALFVRTAAAAVKDARERGEERTGNGESIARDAIGRSVGTMTSIPHVKSDSASHQCKRKQYAQCLSCARRKVQPGIACFTLCFVKLVIVSHIYSHPERNRRTLSHIIIASRLSPTGQGATHAPHWKHERAKRATGVEIGPESVSRFRTSMVIGSPNAGQASRHSLQPIQASNSCLT